MLLYKSFYKSQHFNRTIHHMRVLIAEDEPDIWKAYKITLESKGHEALISEDGNECIKIYKKELFEQQKEEQTMRIFIMRIRKTDLHSM